MHQRQNGSKASGFAVAVALFGFFGLIGSSARVSSASLARLTGGGYSGVLSSNQSIRKQQLICDPASAPLSGMTSVKYDASIVALTAFDFAPGYTGSGAVEVRGTVQVKQSNGCWLPQTKTFLQPLPSFLNCPQGTETGYVQVYYKKIGTPQEMCPPSGFKTVDANGLNGTDTHDLMFNYRSNVNDTAMANYTVYADPGKRASGNGTDFLTGLGPDGKPFTLCPSQLAPASVSGSLVAGPAKGGDDDEGDDDKGDGKGHGHPSKPGRAHSSLLRATSFAAAGGAAAPTSVPLPPALWTGMAMLAGLGLMTLRGRAVTVQR